MLAEENFSEKLLAEEEKFREVVSRKENKKSTSRSIKKISCLKISVYVPRFWQRSAFNEVNDWALRCVTVHGTHNVNVINNVAYNTYGHCYFMEDGGEKNNTFHHNLGLLTQRMVPDVLDRNGTIPSVCQQFVYSIFCQYNICLHFSGSNAIYLLDYISPFSTHRK